MGVILLCSLLVILPLWEGRRCTVSLFMHGWMLKAGLSLVALLFIFVVVVRFNWRRKDSIRTQDQVTL